MSSRNRIGGLGRGLGALIPPAAPAEGPTDSPAPVENAVAARTGTENRKDADTGSDPTDVIFGAARRDSTAPTGSNTESATPDIHDSVVGARYAEIDVAAIRPNAQQPRQVFDEDALGELVHSIREFGVLQPVVVRPVEGGYELVMGERRLRAATLAGLDAIPAIVRTTPDDAMLRDALLENLHRAQLNPLEEAAAYRQLLDDFETTHDELAHRLGRSRPQVSNTVRLLNLPLAVQRRVAAGVLSAGHARALLALDDADAQDELAARIVAEGLSVRATEEAVLIGRGRAPRARRVPATRISAPAADSLAQTLSDAFDTRVRVDVGQRKGRITVEFASVDDLERIVALMAPQVADAARSPRLAHLQDHSAGSAAAGSFGDLPADGDDASAGPSGGS